MNKHIVNFLEKRNIYLTKQTNKKLILNLLKDLYPIKSDKELIRFGPKSDGGYLLPDDLDGIEACFSPGVSNISRFEADCADIGMKVFLADYSVDKPTVQNDLFYFTKKNIGSYSNEITMTLDEWVYDSLPDSINSDLLLQMDIEGSEYETFINISSNLMKRFRIIIVEFHNLNELWNLPYFKFVSLAFKKILSTHTCVHIHPNNRKPITCRQGVEIPRLAEFTFIRNNRIKNFTYASLFPHKLDFDNTSNSPISLPKCWYKQSSTSLQPFQKIKATEDSQFFKDSILK